MDGIVPVPIPQQGFDFTPKNEVLALKVVCTDRSFPLKWYGRIEPTHWQNEWNSLIFRAVSSYYTRYKDIPTTAILEQELLAHATINDPIREMLQYLHDEVLAQTVSDQDARYIKDQLLTHIQHRDWSAFALECAGLIRDGSFTDIPKALAKIAGRHTINEIEKEYGEEKVRERSAEEEKEYNVYPSIYPTFNLNHGGGHVTGTVLAYMGPTGSGKSIMLVNDGANALLQGKNVYHFTFELSKRKTQARYDVVLTGATYKQRKENPAILDNTLGALRQKGMGKLFVIERPNGTFSTNDVAACLDEHYMATGVKPDVVILDYMSIMIPNDPGSTDMTNDYSKLKRIAEDIRALAMARKFDIHTALQSNRDSMNKVDSGIRKNDIADSFAVLHVLDDVLSINQNDFDKKNGRINFFLAKSRDFRDNYWLCCGINYDNLQVREIIEETKSRNDSVGSTDEGSKPSSARDGKSEAKALPAPPVTAEIDPNAAILAMAAAKPKNEADELRAKIRQKVGYTPEVKQAPVTAPRVITGAPPPNVVTVPAPPLPTATLMGEPPIPK